VQKVLEGAAEETPRGMAKEIINDPDQDLVRRAQDGDTRAFDALVEKFSPRLYGLVYNMTSNRDDTQK